MFKCPNHVGGLRIRHGYLRQIKSRVTKNKRKSDSKALNPCDSVSQRQRTFTWWKYFLTLYIQVNIKACLTVRLQVYTVISSVSIVNEPLLSSHLCSKWKLFIIKSTPINNQNLEIEYATTIIGLALSQWDPLIQRRNLFWRFTGYDPVSPSLVKLARYFLLLK